MWQLAQGISFSDLTEAQQAKVTHLGEMNEEFINVYKYWLSVN